MKFVPKGLIDNIQQGCHGQGKVREIPVFLRVREFLLQVREFCNLLSKSGKSQGTSSVVSMHIFH